ncbi:MULTISPECIES: response regulator [Maricaulis]|jgi:DNA-binding response OmpR family regulator|uniref:Response regulator receiver protein n=1 Tax=Maricaulis maris (strain MCS10) TaxID=394221 RepID=Q0AL07_MARMM|nr:MULTISPECIES: response regulator [Maricaulis]ABI67036.1 response regulator receiver protein [Maricaulis maris MCS10]MAC89900.1 response regulator [Maricaulis sp.]
MKPILVVQNEPMMTTLLCHRLTMNGHSVLTAIDGRSALDLVSWARPKLVLVDMLLPDMRGLDVLSRLKHQPATADVPVMMLLPYAHEGDTVAALESGAHDCLVKPIQPRELVARIAGALSRQKVAA